MSHFFVIEGAYKSYLDTAGLNGELIFKKAGIPPKSITDEGVSVTKEQYIALMESMDTYTTDDHILMMSNVDQVAMFIPPVFAGLCSKDGAGCFERLSKYKKLCGPFVLNVEQDESMLSLEFIFDDSKTPIPRFTILSEQVLMVGLLRKATGLHITPAEVTSVYDYGDGAIESYLGTKPVKSDRNLLKFHMADMKEPFLTQNNTMWSYLEPEFTKRLKEMETDDSFAAKVRSVLVELIPAGTDNVEAVAKELAVSPRTLQRKLSTEKTTFIKQLNHTRELMARNFLKDRTISNDEIAFLIGYSDANAFGRAFRSWTGMTVGAYRKQYAA